MKKVSNYKKMLFTSILSICLSVLVLGVAAFAWFSSNKDVDSDGMKMKIESTPNLIIDSNATSLYNVTGPTTSNFSVTFSSDAVLLKPATHDGAVGAGSWTYSTGLKYLTNTEDVGVSTGVAATPQFSAAANGTSTYYVDFVVYIASASQNMDITSLDVQLLTASCTIGDSTGPNDTLSAASIDFYAGTGDISASNSTYKGTLNVAGLTYSSNANGTYNSSATTTSIQIQNGGTVPYNRTSTTSYIKVILRCYFDGALSKISGTTYVNTTAVDTGDVSLAVKFTATTND